MNKHYPLQSIIKPFIVLLLLFCSSHSVLAENTLPDSKHLLKYRFGGREILIPSGAIDVGYESTHLMPNDEVSSLYFLARIDKDGTVFLKDDNVPSSYKEFNEQRKQLKKYNWVVVTVEATRPYFQGGMLRFQFKHTILEDNYHYSLEKGEKYGLKRYVYQSKSHKKLVAPIHGEEYYLQMGRHQFTPTTFIEVTYSDNNPFGLIDHSFMLDNGGYVQIDASYSFSHIEDWQSIERVLRQYINKLMITME